MKKIEMGKKYRTWGGSPVRLLCVDADNDRPVVGLVFDNTLKDINEWLYHWDQYGSYLGVNDPRGEDLVDLVEISPYADIPIDTPGWARGYDGEWVPRYFAGINDAGNPMAWTHGATSFSTDDGGVTSWDEFTTTRPEGVE